MHWFSTSLTQTTPPLPWKSLVSICFLCLLFTCRQCKILPLSHPFINPSRGGQPPGCTPLLAITKRVFVVLLATSAWCMSGLWGGGVPTLDSEPPAHRLRRYRYTFKLALPIHLFLPFVWIVILPPPSYPPPPPLTQSHSSSKSPLSTKNSCTGITLL